MHCRIAKIDLTMQCGTFARLVHGQCGATLGPSAARAILDILRCALCNHLRPSAAQKQLVHPTAAAFGRALRGACGARAEITHDGPNA